MNNKNWLQLMAEGGEGAPAEGQDRQQVQQEVTQEPEDLNAEFDKLVKGDGKCREIFGKRVQSAAQKRTQGLKSIADKYNAMAPALEILAARYGTSADDPALIEKISGDKSLLDNLAMEKGSSSDAELEIAKAVAAQNRANALVQQIMANQEMEKWTQDAQAMKEDYPDFSLEAELQDPNFQKLLRNGVTMEGAYLALHFGQVKRQMTARAEKKAADAVAAGAKRPRENGMGSQAGAALSADPAKMSKEEFEDYMRRVERGERISFSS